MTYQQTDLTALAKQHMLERGLEPEFSREITTELEQINQPGTCGACKDLRELLWCSIDNDDSRDLDQLTFAEKMEGDQWRVFVAIADVDSLVKKGSAIDRHAQTNTTSVYTPTKIFSMLPEKLSTNLTSLNDNEDRVAIVVQITVSNEGAVIDSEIFQAMVHNHAQLTYNGVGGWLEERSQIPEKVTQISGLDSVLKLQHEAAQTLRKKRFERGALTLASTKVEAKVHDDQVSLQLTVQNYAHQLIEEFMIAANFCMATKFKNAKVASLRRVVRIPLRWDRIVEIAHSFGETLPAAPDSKELDKFLVKRKEADPESFPDLSLAIIKLLGRGEYIVENVGDSPIGHFGLALMDYTHATAPNRRFPDLITQRQCKAYLQGTANVYSVGELRRLADQCTQQEDAATKVERQMSKSAAAMLLSSQIGSFFKGIVTGASSKGTWVRIFNPPVEGKVVSGFQHLDVGDKVSVKLIYVDIPRGYIDFEASSHRNY